MYFKNKSVQPFLSSKEKPGYCNYLLLDLSDKENPVAISTDGEILVKIPIVLEDDDFTDFEDDFPVFLTRQMYDSNQFDKHKSWRLLKDRVYASGIQYEHLILKAKDEVYFPNYNDKEGILNEPGDYCFMLEIPLKQIHKVLRAYGRKPAKVVMQVFRKEYPDGSVKEHFRLDAADGEVLGYGMMDHKLMALYKRLENILQENKK